MKTVIAAVAIALATSLTGCGTPSQPAHVVSSSDHTSSEYGVVESVEVVEADKGGVGVGAIAGGVLGGVLGHQIGSGRGNTVATIAGAVGGAYAGDKIEDSRKQSQYRLTLRMDNGNRIALTQNDGSYHTGDRIVYRNGTVSHR